ncbi:unnamed protein product [Ilex paraguariensis]|uniref:Uncharacterized protein n=1 Tax=Ilex paraguariensis TaxID=185542 RepID=A0ABC8R8S3_9AQUA
MIWKTSDGGHLLWSLFILGNINSISSPYPAEAKSFNLLSKTSKIKASLKRNEFPLISKRSTKTPRRLITISTSDGRWHGEWKRDYLFSLQDLQLEDLAEDGHRDAEVSITLFIHKVIPQLLIHTESVHVYKQTCLWINNTNDVTNNRVNNRLP